MRDVLCMTKKQINVRRASIVVVIATIILSKYCGKRTKKSSVRA